MRPRKHSDSLGSYKPRHIGEDLLKPRSGGGTSSRVYNRSCILEETSVPVEGFGFISPRRGGNLLRCKCSVIECLSLSLSFF